MKNSDTASRRPRAAMGVTHCQVLTKTFELAAYPTIGNLLSPSLLEFC
jgi:hypothetical protein